MNAWNNKSLTEKSKELRKNMTKEERHLWYDFLKHLDVTVQRQKVLNRYIADFYIHSARLIIELDGSQHYSEQGEMTDSVRDDYFRRNGYTVLRYSNYEIHNNFRGVCEDIMLHLTPHPPRSGSAPSPRGEGYKL